MRTSTSSPHRRHLAYVLGGAVLALAGASPAAADPPVHTTIPFTLVVQDAGAECGFPIRWDISGEQRETRFFDDQGRLERIVVHVRETNTLTNLATGKTITDEPKFNQIVVFNENGTIASVQTTGLFVTHETRLGQRDGRRQRSSSLACADRARPRVRCRPAPGPSRNAEQSAGRLSAFCDVLA
jgi:hypothetical protein